MWRAGFDVYHVIPEQYGDIEEQEERCQDLDCWVCCSRSQIYTIGHFAVARRGARVQRHTNPRKIHSQAERLSRGLALPNARTDL